MRRFLASAVLAALLAFTISSSADEPIASAAREHFRAGVLLLQDPEGARFEEAYREFVAAYAASPSPKILGNLGFCAMKLERDAEAIEAYTRYLAEVRDIETDEREQITHDLSTMKTGLVRVSITVDVDGATLVDTRALVHGSPIVNTYGPVHKTIEIGVRPGRHTLRAKGSSGESTPWELDATPGGRFTHAFVLVAPRQAQPPEPPPAPSSRVVPWLVTGIGGAMLVGGAVAGAIVLKKVNQLDTTCPNNECPTNSGLVAERDAAKQTMRVADILLIGGGAVFTTGVVWLLLSGGSSRPTTGRSAPQTQAGLTCTPSGCVAQLGGRF